MEKILTCKNCLMPSSRPRVNFNKDQICNGCLHQFEKKEILNHLNIMMFALEII